MPPATIDVFSEGQTEDRVLQQLRERGLCAATLQPRGGGGEDEMMRKLDLRLRQLRELPTAQPGHRLLVIRDKDQRDVGDVCRSVESLIQRYWPTARLSLHQDHRDVFVLQPEPPELRLALHVVTHKLVAAFCPTLAAGLRKLPSHVRFCCSSPVHLARICEERDA